MMQNKTKPAADHPGLPLPRRYFAILAVLLGAAVATIDGTIVNVALPTIARELNIAASDSVMIVTVYQLVLVMTLLPYSKIGDLWGHKTVYQLGQVVFILGTLLCCFADNLPLLLLARVIQGLGAGAVVSVGMAMIRSIYPSTMLGRGIALHIFVVSCSGALAPSLGGYLLQFGGWRWVFIAVAPVAIVSLAIGARALPDAIRNKMPFDIVAAALSAATFGSLVVGVEALVHGGSKPMGAAMLLASLVLGVVFIRRELRATHPMLPVDLLVRPLFYLSSTGSMCAFVAQAVLLVSLSFRLQEYYHFSPAKVGTMMSPIAIGSMIAGPISGVLSDRAHPGILGGVGMILSTVAMLAIAMLPGQPEYFDVAWRMTLCGIGMGLFFPSNSRVIMAATPANRAASATGLIGTTRLLGQTLGASLAAGLLAFGLGFGSIPALIGAALTAIGGACSLLRINPRISEAR